MRCGRAPYLRLLGRRPALTHYRRVSSPAFDDMTSPAALIGIDWGTTSFRAYRIGADGGVVDSKAPRPVS